MQSKQNWNSYEYFRTNEVNWLLGPASRCEDNYLARIEESIDFTTTVAVKVIDCYIVSFTFIRKTAQKKLAINQKKKIKKANGYLVYGYIFTGGSLIRVRPGTAIYDTL